MKRKVDFVIAGAMKSGTTALHSYLRQHPDIGMADIKEVRFFDDDKNFQRRKPSYASYHFHFWDVRSRKVLGESTPMYMYWQKTPGRLWQYNPGLKIIIILRNPLDRAYSHWNMNRHLKKEARSFWNALHFEKEQFSKKPDEQYQGFAYVGRGFYVEQLQRIWTFFPKGQTLVLRSEDVKENPRKTLDGVCHFLEIRPLDQIGKEEGYVLSYDSPMSEREREFLRDALRPEMKKLEKLLGWDCSNWLAS